MLEMIPVQWIHISLGKAVDTVSRGIQPFDTKLSFGGIRIECETGTGFHLPRFKGDLTDTALGSQAHPAIPWQHPDADARLLLLKVSMPTGIGAIVEIGHVFMMYDGSTGPQAASVKAFRVRVKV